MKIDKLQEGLKLIKLDNENKFDNFLERLNKEDKSDFLKICKTQNWNISNAKIDLDLTKYN